MACLDLEQGEVIPGAGSGGGPQGMAGKHFLGVGRHFAGIEQRLRQGLRAQQMRVDRVAQCARRLDVAEAEVLALVLVSEQDENGDGDHARQ